jgi:hypothetical protein
MFSDKQKGKEGVPELDVGVHEGVIARNEVTKQSPPLTAIASWRLLRFARNDKSKGGLGAILNVRLNGYSQTIK